MQYYTHTRVRTGIAQKNKYAEYTALKGGTIIASIFLINDNSDHFKTFLLLLISD